MHEVFDLLRLGADLVKALQHPIGRIGGRGRHLVQLNVATFFIQDDHIGKGAAYID